MEGHIYIYGKIGAGDFLDMEGGITVKDVQEQMSNVPKKAKTVVVHIHSEGGLVHEGFAIHDFLQASGKKIITRIEGLCASIATVVALAGVEREMTPNSDFFIHNPWGMADGDTDQIQEYAAELKKTEQKLINFYHNATGADKDELDKLMKKQTTFTPEQALEMGFITKIAEPLKAVAMIKPNKDKDMSKITKILNEIKEMISGEQKPVNLDLTLADGTEVVVETEADTPAVGDMVTIGGEAAPDGDHTLADGTVITTEAGAITAIAPAEEELDYKAKYEEAKAELDKLKEAEEKTTEAVEELKKEVQAFKKMSSTYKPQPRKAQFNDKGEDNSDPVAERKERAKQYKRK